MPSPLSSLLNGSAPDTVMIAEDDRVFRTLLQNWLECWGYKAKVAEDGAAAWRELQSENHPRLLLLDWMMPGMDGVEICRRIRALQTELYSYILVVTSKADKRDAITELRARMQVGRRILILQDELVRSREQLRRQATLDSLTGLLNRRAVIESLTEELARSSRVDASVGVLMLDIDEFKYINDSYGHQVGDAVLAEVAGRLVSALRTYDKVGRYGGEEFLAVLPDCSAELLDSVAERIRSRIMAKRFVTASAEISVTVSVGGAISEPAHQLRADEGIRSADLALYRAKNNGRNCCVIDIGPSSAPIVA